MDIKFSGMPNRMCHRTCLKQNDDPLTYLLCGVLTHGKLLPFMGEKGNKKKNRKKNNNRVRD